MGALIVIIIAGLLFYFDIIVATTFYTIVFASLAWVCIGVTLYIVYDCLRFFYHDILHWHRPNRWYNWHDGLSEHSVCKHCGKSITRDSQGNWY